jgi:uncharacterized protein YlzI (FlbEa/FlbD family)
MILAVARREGLLSRDSLRPEAAEMRKFIRIENVQGTPIFVNPDHIVSIQPSADDPDNPAIVQLITGGPMKVKQNVEEIQKRIQNID